MAGEGSWTRPGIAIIAPEMVTSLILYSMHKSRIRNTFIGNEMPSILVSVKDNVAHMHAHADTLLNEQKLPAFSMTTICHKPPQANQ